MANSYAMMYKVYGDPKFYGNGLRFDTRDGAEDRASAKFYAWTQCEEYRVDESDDAPNVFAEVAA